MGKRTLLLWQIAADDGCGRVISNRLIAATIADGCRYDDETVRAIIESASAQWRRDAAGSHQAFGESRLLRQRAIVAEGQIDRDRPPALVQRGLFERRSERARLIAATALAAADHDHVERLAAIERAGVISFREPRLLLVLTP
jgi:hypothetical protein